MDPAAHFLTGAFLARAISRERKERLLFWTLCIAAMIPDMDVVFSPWGNELYSLYHRGFTHSFAGAVLMAAPFALVLWKKGVRSFPTALAFSVTAVWLHVVTDWATSFGTPVAMPFSDRNCSLDVLSNFNWIFWIVGFGLLYHLRDHGRSAFRAVALCVGLLVGYMVAGRKLTSRLMAGEDRFDVIPHLANPLIWRVHAADTELKEYRLYHVRPFTGNVRLILKAPMMVDGPEVLAAKESPMVRLFFKHNRWPVAEVERAPDGWLVRFSNLLYYWGGRWGERIEIQLNRNLEVVGSKKVYQAWN